MRFNETMKKIAFLLSATLPLIFLTGFFGDKPSVLSSKTNDIWVELSQEQAKNAITQIPSLAPLVNRAKPAVLVVTTESNNQVNQFNSQLPPGFDDFFRFFSPGLDFKTQERKNTGLGSGFMIHPSGLALTNNHVIEGASKIRIKIGNDLKEYEGEIVGTDPDTDVALIQIKSNKKDWPVIPLGNSSAVQIGDFAMAIGNPFGLEHSISFGPVSARGRRDIQPSGKKGLFDFIQLSAPINPGNSGGALLNMAGEVIGINTAISASGQGIAFAIPIDQVKYLLPQLKKDGKASRSGMGVRIENVSPELAKEIGLSYTHGALVKEVIGNSAAFRAGVQPGDVITEFDGRTVSDSSYLQVEAGLAGVGKSVPIKLYRDGKVLIIKLVLEALPKEESLKTISPKGLSDIGIKVLDYQDQFVKGVRIVEIDSQSPAAVAGLEPNDIILKVNNQITKDTNALVKTIQKTSSSGLLKMLVRRGTSTLFYVVQKPEL